MIYTSQPMASRLGPTDNCISGIQIKFELVNCIELFHWLQTINDIIIQVSMMSHLACLYHMVFGL